MYLDMGRIWPAARGISVSFGLSIDHASDNRMVVWRRMAEGLCGNDMPP